jgi:quinoprotein relay system zinc metallohydrolase 2
MTKAKSEFAARHSAPPAAAQSNLDRGAAPFDEMRRKLLGGVPPIVVSALLGPIFSTVSKATTEHHTLVEAAPGVLVKTGRHAIADPANGGDIANLACVVGSEAVAVIDTGGSFRVGSELSQLIAVATQRPIRYVINTHMHPDHVLGNAAFERPGVEFIAHHKMARALAARAEGYLVRAREQIGATAFEGTKIVYPTRGVDGDSTIDLGGRRLLLKARATAHTDNDLTVFDEQTQTLITGDVVFAGHIPTIDGSIAGWLKLIDVMAAEQASRVVPGHGPASLQLPDALAPLRRYLETVANDVRAAIKDGKTIAEAVATAAQSERANWQLFDEHHARNVTAAFAELEWE